MRNEGTTRLPKSLCVLISAAATLAFLGAMLSGAGVERLDYRDLHGVIGTDKDKRELTIWTCHDENADPGGTPPLLGPADCEWPYEGEYCVMCDMPLTIGQKIGGLTGDPVHNPQDHACYGDLIIGICTWHPQFNIWYCDTSEGWVDGECGGNITYWRGQPSQPPPGDP